MKHISADELLLLIFKYTDKEKLLKENPSVTQEMIDTLVQEISHTKKGEKSGGIGLHHPATKHKKEEPIEFIIHTDGASRGNPGNAGIGVVILNKNRHVIEEIGRFIGRSTNNVAEYQAMILAAQKAVEYNAGKVTFKTDSELLVRQINGMYQVKSSNILPLYKELMAFLNKIPAWKIQHVRREENAHADALANQGIDTAL